MDNKTTKIYKTDVYPWKKFCISVAKEPVSGEIRIGIGAVVV